MCKQLPGVFSIRMRSVHNKILGCDGDTSCSAVQKSTTAHAPQMNDDVTCLTVLFFWVVMPCSWRWGQYFPPKRWWYLPTNCQQLYCPEDQRWHLHRCEPRIWYSCIIHASTSRSSKLWLHLRSPNQNLTRVSCFSNMFGPSQPYVHTAVAVML
jgi:hypothetical protein